MSRREKIMSKWSKVLVLFIILSMTIVVAGCTPTTEPTTEPTAEPTAEPTTEVYDFGGREVRILGWWTVSREEGLSEYHDKYLERIDEVDSKFNVKVVFPEIPMESYFDNVAASALAGDPIADLFYHKNTSFLHFVTNNMYAPLDDLGVFDFNNKTKWDPFVMEATGYQGKQYGLMTFSHDIHSMIAFNKTIFDNENLPDLYTLYENGEWTWSKMLEIAKSATKATGGTNEIDQWGFSWYYPDFAAYSLIYSNNGKTWDINEDGTITNMFASDNTLEALNFLNQISNIDNVAYKQDGEWDHRVKKFGEGKIAMFDVMGWHLPYFSEIDFGLVPYPVGPKGTGHVMSASNLGYYAMFSSIEKPEEIAMVYDALTEPLFPDEPDRWKEQYETNLRDVKSMEMIEEVFYGDVQKVFNPHEGFGFDWLANFEFFDGIVKGAKTPVVAVEEIRPVFEAHIADMLAD